MNENVQVINKNGDGMVTEGIAYIELTETNKKYLFYTLNEKVDNDLTKIYIAEVSEQVGGANPISDAEWDDLRKKMVKISHKEELPEVNYLNMGEQSFNVGEPKKLAVTTVAKQAFKDAQITHTVSTNQTDTPVVTGTSTFFSQEEVPAETNQMEQNNESIFANPPQPVENAVVSETQAPVQQEVVEEPAVEPIQPQVNEVVPGQVETQNTEVLTETPAVPVIEPVTPVLEENVAEQPVAEQPVAPVEPNIQPETIVPEVPAVPEVPEIPAAPVAPVVDTPEVSDDTDTTNSGTTKTIISDEEALKAINVIQEYIDQEEAGQ